MSRWYSPVYMTNPADTSMGMAVNHLGQRVLEAAEQYDNLVEAQAADAIALIITGQEYESAIPDLESGHPVRVALSELAAALQAALDR